MGPREAVASVFSGIMESGDQVYIHREDYAVGRFMVWILGRMDGETLAVKEWAAVVMDTRPPGRTDGGARLYAPDDPDGNTYASQAEALRDALELIEGVQEEELNE